LLGIFIFPETPERAVEPDQRVEKCRLQGEKVQKWSIGDLRTMTSGRGQFSMEFSHYAACPRNISDDVIAKAKAREEELRK